MLELGDSGGGDEVQRALGPRPGEQAQDRLVAEVMARRGDVGRVWRDVVGALPTAVVTTDATGTVLDANPAAARLLGAQGDLRGASLWESVADDQRPLAEELARAAARGETPSAPLVVVAAGRHVPVDCLVTALVWVGGEADPAAADHAPVGQLCCTWVLASPVAHGRGGPGDDELAAVAELCALPLGVEDAQGILRRIAALATRAVPGADWSSLTLGDPAAPDSTASDSRQAQGGDGAQWRAGEGPCCRAWGEGVPVVTADVRADDRWPQLARVLAEAPPSPVRGALGVPVVVADRVAGVLNLYSSTVGGLTAQASLERARTFTAAAGAVLADARRLEELAETAEGLREAMRSRAGIEQAKGMVAVWLGGDVEDAFDVLREVSQERHVKLRDLAASVRAAGPTRDGLREAVLAARAQSAAG